ncbi:MAG: hypothetical protein EOO47_22315 [Flavobacterium sp.]|nr:MAG: hypothetical protein EOO47_22315 [Flavobacterium sp.]
MARRKSIISKQHYAKGLQLEQAEDSKAALKYYQKAVVSDPLNSMAWNRQMIIYRKSKSKVQEVKLIKTAINQYQKRIAADHENWLNNHQQKADSSRALAKVLGMLEDNGLPKAEHPIVERWETRLYLLEYRLKNARRKKA